MVEDADFAVISRRDAPAAVVISPDTFNSMMETAHLLRSPANARHLGEAIAQYRKGKTEAWNQDDT